ncbi:PAS domain-containing protein [Pseudomonadota bacterium AL_CKDN230030165-1A_HGKHYDSX7]
MAASVDPSQEEQFHEEVRRHFGVLPNFFRAFPGAYDRVHPLWSFARSAYIDNPLPAVFKERLFVYLSRFCRTRYCVVRHTGYLAGLGHAAGDPQARPQSLEAIMWLLRRPVPDASAAERSLLALEACAVPGPLPEPGSHLDTQLYDALTLVFLAPEHGRRACAAVRQLVGDAHFEPLNTLLAFIRAAHHWSETHPELEIEPDMVAFLGRHREIARLLMNPDEAADASVSIQLRRAQDELELAEHALQDSEDRYIGLIEGIAQAIWETDHLGRIVADSPTWRRYTGQTLDQWLNNGGLIAIHPEDRALADGAWREALAHGTSLDAEFRLWHAGSAAYRWTNVRVAPVRAANGTILKWLGMNLDIDERKQAEARLREREADLARVQRIGEVGGVDIDVAGGMRSWRSPEYLRLHGLPPHSIEESHEQWLARLHPDDRLRAQRILLDALSGNATSYDNEYRIIRPSDGETRWIHARADIERDAHGQAVRLVGAHLDVTEQKRLQQALHEREERQRMQLKLADALRPLASPQSIQREAARQLGEYLGVDRAFYAEVDPAGSVTVNAEYRGDLASAIPTQFRLDEFGLGPCAALGNGSTLAVRNVEQWEVLSPLDLPAYLRIGVAALIKVPLVKEGRLVAFLGVHQDAPRDWSEGDVTLLEEVAERTWAAVERARAESALRESEERLRGAVEVGQLGLWDWNLLTGEMHWSDQLHRMEGYAPGEVVPSYEAWMTPIHPDDRGAAEAALRNAMGSHGDYVQEFRVIHGDGSVHWLYGRGRFFYDVARRPVRMIGATVETTERRDLEDRQRVLVAELQHRTRNLLAVVRSMADKTVRSSVDLRDFRRRFGDRLDALGRVQGLLSRLNDHDRVAFDELIHEEFSAIEGRSERVRLEGPAGVRLRSSTVQMLAMAIHELATNAVKYGALGQPRGRLAVTWRFEPHGEQGKPWLHIDWHETGVVMPAADIAPRGSGQGRELVERALPYQLNAHTTFTLGEDGVRCLISLPVSNTLAEGAEAR